MHELDKTRIYQTCEAMHVPADSRDVRIWTELAATLIKKRQFEEAIDVLHVAIGCDPFDGYAWLALALAYCKVGRLEEAKSAMRMARRHEASEQGIAKCMDRIRQAEQNTGRLQDSADHPGVSLEEADQRE